MRLLPVLAGLAGAILCALPVAAQTVPTPAPTPAPRAVAPALFGVTDVPHVIACRDMFDESDRIDYFYLTAATRTTLDYESGNDHMVYNLADGAFIDHLHGDEWDCMQHGLSLPELTARGRAFSMLHPYTGTPVWATTALPPPPER